MIYYELKCLTNFIFSKGSSHCVAEICMNQCVIWEVTKTWMIQVVSKLLEWRSVTNPFNVRAKQTEQVQCELENSTNSTLARAVQSHSQSQSSLRKGCRLPLSIPTPLGQTNSSPRASSKASVWAAKLKMSLVLCCYVCVSSTSCLGFVSDKEL